MTSLTSKNASLTPATTKIHYLLADKNGFPLNRQVPKTYQEYRGVGGETITYDGSDELVIYADLLTGNLIINFGSGTVSSFMDLIGRSVVIQVNGATNRTITLNTAPIFMKINGTALTQLTNVIPGDGKSKSITMYFNSVNQINIDYGASSSAVVPVTPTALQGKTIVINGEYQSPVFITPTQTAIGGTPPYTWSGPPTFGDPPDYSGSLIANTYYPPTRRPSDYYSSFPINVTDSLGATTQSMVVYYPTVALQAGGANGYTLVHCTFLSQAQTGPAVQSIITSGINKIQILTTGIDMITIAGNSNESLFYYVESPTPDTLKCYDSVIGVTFTLIANMTTVGITKATTMSYNHDTDQLFIFESNVTGGFSILAFTQYVRGSVLTIPTVVSRVKLMNSLNPVAGSPISAIYGTNTVVTGCEFVDGRDIVVLALFDPTANRAKFISLNASTFSNTGINNGNNQYILGSFTGAGVFGAGERVSLFSQKIQGLYRLGYCSQSRQMRVVTDYTMGSITGTESPTVLNVTGIMPVEVRATRVVLNT